MTALPLIDIALLDQGEAARRQLAAAIRGACINHGFFYLVGHGVPEADFAAVLAEARRFFALPLDVKDQCAQRYSICYRGYEAMGAQALEPGMPADVKEAFFLGRDLPMDDPRVVARWFNHGPNLWPADLPGFAATLMAHLDRMTALARRVMAGIALSLDLPDDYFNAMAEEPLAIMRLLHYPPQPVNPQPGEKGCGTHTDWGCITLLLQDQAGGLQVETPQGWIDAPPLPGALVVNIGDMMARWTNDRYRSTPHRVINLSGGDRYSAPIFFEGNPVYPVACLPGCSSPDNPPRYPPTTVIAHLEEMYRKTYL